MKKYALAAILAIAASTTAAIAAPAFNPNAPLGFYATNPAANPKFDEASASTPAQLKNGVVNTTGKTYNSAL